MPAKKQKGTVRIFVNLADVPYVTSILKGTVRAGPEIGHEVEARLGREKAEQRQKPVEFKHYKGRVMSAEIPAGSVTKLQHFIAVGKIGNWQGAEKVGVHFVHVKGHRGHPEGIILTPYSAAEVKAGGGRLITERMRGTKRVEMGREGDTVLNAFKAYGTRVRKGSAPWKPPLVMYSTRRRRPR